MSIDRWMDKEVMVHIHNGLLLTHKKECIWVSSNEVDEPAAAKSLQPCLTLCDPIDGSPPGSPVPGILQARTLEWVAISFSNAWKWKMKMKSLSRVRLLATPWTAAYQALLSMGFARQEYWSGVPLPHWTHSNKGVHGGSAGKESACSAGDLGSIPGLGRSSGGSSQGIFPVGKATHSSILAWRIPWTVYSMGLQRVGQTERL